MGEPLLKISNLGKSFGSVKVFENADLDVYEGEVVSIIGSSGSGKTTLLRCINLLEQFQEGIIWLDGNEVGYKVENGKRKRYSEHIISQQRQMTGMVFQQFNLFPHMTALKNVMLGLIRVKKLPHKEAEEISLKWLERVGLSDKVNSYPAQLSGGQQQRVAIARALAMNPRIVLFDEATSALDPELVGEVLNVIKQLANDGITMILVTHEMRFAYDISDKVVFMDAGKIAAIGTPKEIFEDKIVPRLKEFLYNFNI
jgi:polar amino acid transport system ATP-binding protein